MPVLAIALPLLVAENSLPPLFLSSALFTTLLVEDK